MLAEWIWTKPWEVVCVQDFAGIQRELEDRWRRRNSRPDMGLAERPFEAETSEANGIIERARPTAEEPGEP
jgi:hypothetical protein